jgi:hypothetical protein
MRILVSAAGLAIALFLTACGGGGGTSTSSTVVTGSVAPTVAISAQPAATSVYDTQQAVFSVTASGNGALAYQWYKNSAIISGETSSSLTTAATTLSDDGASFSVAITDSGGKVLSSAALLTVQASATAIVTQPTNQSVIAGQTALFTVTASGLPGLSYQWQKNGQKITGAGSSSYSTPVTLSDNASQYSVTVTNGVGSAITSSASVLTVQASTLTDLVVSEVSTCYYADIDCWFELYNPTSSPINLSGYQVRANSIDTNAKSAITPSTFSLPNLNIPPDGYVVVSGNNRNAPQRGLQTAPIRSGNSVPFWTANGFIELLKTGITVDFVRFGTSSQAPVTAGNWSGASASALPSSVLEYGKSMVRMYPGIATTNTRSANDWSSVMWTTPAGRNDVPSNASDDDQDGIPNSAEVPGGTFAGMDLYAMGARAAQKDLFININAMTSSDVGVAPRPESLQKVVNSFAAHGIQVHFDAGNLFGGSFSVANFNLGQGNSMVPHEPCVTFDQVTCSANASARRSVYDWKDEYMDMRRKSIFHYLLFGNSQKTDGSNGSSGLAELQGNDFIVTMGNWGLSNAVGVPLNVLINMQASTIMHELGHNLGLKHGGFEDTNYKPNYWSAMNYLYQLSGLDGNPDGSTAYQRWRNQKGDGTPTMCNLANSPCGPASQFMVDYSNGSGSDLNEMNLLETANLGRGSVGGGYADWDLGGSLTSAPIIKDLDGDGAQKTLLDSNDWGNLSLPFNRNFGANSGVGKTTRPTARVPDPIADDRQPVAEEVAPSKFFFDQLKRHAQ